MPLFLNFEVKLLQPGNSLDRYEIYCYFLLEIFLSLGVVKSLCSIPLLAPVIRDMLSLTMSLIAWLPC